MHATVIKSFETLADIEQAIKETSEKPGIPLQIPKDSLKKKSGAMRDVSRLQMLTTWARSSPECYLEFHRENRMESVLEDLCAYAPGIAALRICAGVKIADNVVLKRSALSGAAHKMLDTDAEDLPAIIRGRSIDVSCVSGMRLQYLRPLFFARSPESVKDSDGMYLLIKELFAQINKNDSTLIPESFNTACGIFVSELFKNTQQHAIRDALGELYEAHVEGLIISWTDLKERLYAEDFSGHPKLKSYWEREASADSSGHKNLRCLQLSFFDTGPGFACRATGQELLTMDLEKERRILIDCLKKNTTTKGETGAGHGWPSVLRELQEIGGLVRIRSGRQSIFNCFGENGSDENIFEFSDWNEGATLSPVVGAVITLLVPLRRT